MHLRQSGLGFVMEDRVASESVVVTPRNGGGDRGARGHDARHLSLLV